MKPCCACPETRKERDDCVIKFADWEVRCADFIAAHNRCLREHGFAVDDGCGDNKCEQVIGSEKK